MEHSYICQLDSFITKISYYYAGTKNSLVDPDDLKQVVAERCLTKLGTLSDEKKLYGWLKTIIRNQFLNMQRDLRLRNMREQECASQQGHSIEETSDIFLLELILQAINTLEEEYQDVVRLRLLNGFSTRETAQKLHIPEGTVSSRLQRARKILLKKLHTVLEVT